MTWSHTRANMNKHTYQIWGMRGGGWGLGEGCRLAAMGSGGRALAASHPWPLIPTLTEWSRWRPTKSCDADWILANDAPYLQSEANRGEEWSGVAAWLRCPWEVSMSKFFSSALFAPGLHSVFSPPRVWQNIQWLDTSDWLQVLWRSFNRQFWVTFLWLTSISR